MKLNFNKAATVCGLFASGLIAGYSAARFSGPLKDRFTAIINSANAAGNYRITPTIPEFEGTGPMDKLGLDLAMNE